MAMLLACILIRHQVVIWDGPCGYRGGNKSLRRTCLDCPGRCMLALRGCTPCHLRDVDLKFACYLRSSLPRTHGQVELAAALAGTCMACGPDAASGVGFTQGL